MGVLHHNRRKRLCALLGFIVWNYCFTFSVSFEAESFDVKIDSYTRESRWDITELLDRMDTCPKLFGLPTSDSKKRHKKSEALFRLEVFVWFTILSIVHFLRTLTALLHASLIRAGDVELNPGPPPPTPPPEMAASPTHDENGPSSPSTPKDTDQLTPTNDEPVHVPHGYTKPLEATSPNSSANLPVDRKVATSVNETVSSIDLHRFQTEKEDSRDVISSVASGDIKIPIVQAEHQKDKSLMIGPEITTRKKGSDSEVGIGAITTKSVQPVARDDEKTDTVVMSPPRPPRTMKRLSLQRTASPKSTASGVRKQSRKKVLQQQEDVMHLLKVVLDKEPVDETTAAKRLLDFFVGANKLYRSGEKCPVCPICLKLKTERGGQRKSHVIPKSILHYYWKIHSTSEQTDFILDFSRDERLAAGSLTYQLLCENCETYYSKTEEQLLHVYLYLAANSNTDIIITHKDKKSPSWIKYILANILFRGILTNIDLDERFQRQNIINEVYTLWKFCSGALEAISEQCSLPDLKIFLLPNKPFCSNLDDFMYPFEMLLRMPRCTELIQQKEAGTFFYTKFDSIHVVLPLCETSRAYFETFNNGVMTEDCNLYLRWSAQPKADIIRQSKSIRFDYSPECASLKDHFPEVLLKWCTSLYEEFVSRLHNHPRPKHSFLSCIERYGGAKYVGFNIEERMQQADALKRKLLDERASQTTTFEEQCKLRDKVLLEECVLAASRQSPLRRRVQEELRQLSEMHNAEMANMNAALANTKRELGETREELGNTRDELANKEQELVDSERHIATLKTEVIHLSAQVSYQNEKLDIARSDLLSSRTELIASRGENASLREEIASAREVSVQQSKERFRTVQFVYTSSLRHARKHYEQNVWIMEELKTVINDMAADFALLMEVTQGSNLHQIYKELHNDCEKLLMLTPPNSPTSTDCEQLKF